MIRDTAPHSMMSRWNCRRKRWRERFPVRRQDARVRSVRGAQGSEGIPVNRLGDQRRGGIIRLDRGGWHARAAWSRSRCPSLSDRGESVPRTFEVPRVNQGPAPRLRPEIRPAGIRQDNSGKTGGTSSAAVAGTRGDYRASLTLSVVGSDVMFNLGIVIHPLASALTAPLAVPNVQPRSRRGRLATSGAGASSRPRWLPPGWRTRS